MLAIYIRHSELQGIQKPKHPNEHAYMQFQRQSSNYHQIIGNRLRRGALRVVIVTHDPLQIKTADQRVLKPLFNMKHSNPRLVDLNGRMLNFRGQKVGKEAQCPFVCWTGKTSGMQLFKLVAEGNKLHLGKAYIAVQMEHVLELNRSSTAALSQRRQFSQNKEDKWLTVTDCVATALEWTLL